MRVGIACLCVLLAAAPLAAQDALAAAQRALDEERPLAALQLLDGVLRSSPDNAEALLMRSTARFMLGEVGSGRADLDRALAVDPTLRQGWLNRAALELADGRLDQALSAFETARELAPDEADNYLNIGAVQLLKGDVTTAQGSFRRYLEMTGEAEDYYLVATNYAASAFGEQALSALELAVGLDERQRLKARADPNFSGLAESPRFKRLLATDGYVPPRNSHQAAQEFAAPYLGGQGGLLRAVLDALQFTGAAVDPRIEVTDAWALVWSEFRIKVSNTSASRGRIELSAPFERFTPSEWLEHTDQFFRQVQIQLAR